MPNRWEHDIQHLSLDEIHKAVDCETWQAFRRSLKGKSTEVKLVRLDDYLRYGPMKHTCPHCNDATRQVQVDNYINALKRGGQLDLEGNVVR